MNNVVKSVSFFLSMLDVSDFCVFRHVYNVNTVSYNTDFT